MMTAENAAKIVKKMSILPGQRQRFLIKIFRTLPLIQNTLLLEKMFNKSSKIFYV